MDTTKPAPPEGYTLVEEPVVRAEDLIWDGESEWTEPHPHEIGAPAGDFWTARPLPAPRPAWTREVPEVPGYYWRRNPGSRSGPEVVEILGDYVCIPTVSHPIDRDEIGGEFWPVPLTPPADDPA
jgi:hypothetical protein